MLCDPGRFIVQLEWSQSATANPTEFLRGYQPRTFQNADVLAHPGEGHGEALRQIADAGIGMSELYQYAATGCVGQRGEGEIQIAIKLNHMVQY